jgi:hypothetical protein
MGGGRKGRGDYILVSRLGSLTLLYRIHVTNLFPTGFRPRFHVKFPGYPQIQEILLFLSKSTWSWRAQQTVVNSRSGERKFDFGRKTHKHRCDGLSQQKRLTKLTMKPYSVTHSCISSAAHWLRGSHQTQISRTVI